MKLQSQHSLLSHLKTLSVGTVGARIPDLPHVSLIHNQLSQPVGNFLLPVLVALINTYEVSY